MTQGVELISLSELITKVKDDLLTQTVIDNKNSRLLFLEEIEITAQVVVKRGKGEGGKAGLSLSVLGFGADAGVDTKTTVARELTQTVTVKLSPLFGKAEYMQGLSPEDKAKVMGTVKQGAVRGHDDGMGDIA